MVLRSRILMGFPLPPPVGCRECGKRKREVAAARCRGATAFVDAVIRELFWRRARRGERRGSANGEAVAVGGFRDDASGGHRGDALIECFGANTAGCAQFGEGLRLLTFRQGGSDALID
jgi:hypothetical protein